MTVSQHYLLALAQARAHHLTSKTYSGKFLRPHAVPIKALIDKHNIDRVLDYGCGKGEQYRWRSHDDETGVPKGQGLEQFWGVPVVKFDPAYPPLAQPEPETIGDGKYGMTLVTHVLGSIPTNDLLGWVFPRLALLTTKVIYIAEKIGPVGKRVFSGAESMPRWDAFSWRHHVKYQSMIHRELEWVLATRESGTAGVVTRRMRFMAGEELWEEREAA